MYQALPRRSRRSSHTDSLVPPLSVIVDRTVRFEEVDSLQMVWHGNYTSWLEDGREAFGERFGVRYLDFHDHGVIVPLKTVSLDYKLPLRYRETYAITASLHWSEAALLEYSYAIRDGAGRLMTLAHTTQLMLSTGGELLLEQPAFYKSFCRNWQAGLFCKL